MYNLYNDRELSFQKLKKKSTRKFPDMNAEGFKISSQGGSGRRIQEGKGHDQNMLHIKKTFK